MSQIFANLYQSTDEIRTHTVDFTSALPTGGTVTTATATHTPPSGSATTPAVSVSSPYVYITVGPLTVTGMHYVDVAATFSDGDKSTARIVIDTFFSTSTARVGMADLITELRSLTEAGGNDYTISNTVFWSDAELQKSLDRYRVDVYQEEMTVVPKYLQNDVDYFTYYLPYSNVESGTALVITDSAGGTAGTALYSVDAMRGIVTFAADTGGTIYSMTGRSYNLEAAAADIWRKKASHYATRAFNFSTDNHKVDREAIYQHCLERVTFFEKAGGNRVTSADIERSDTNA